MSQPVLEKLNGSSHGGAVSVSTAQASGPGSGSTIPHVCIVGAGIAGLRCAEVLIQHGIRVTILEARDRIGGRVSSRQEMAILDTDG